MPRVVEDVDGQRRQGHLDAQLERGVRIAVKPRADEVGDLARVTVELDDVGALDLAQQRPSAALVDAEQAQDASTPLKLYEKRARFRDAATSPMKSTAARATACGKLRSGRTVENRAATSSRIASDMSVEAP